MSKKLQEQIRDEYGNRGLKELEIPSHIIENLRKELREYQIEALKYYLANNEAFKQNHLMFNMATGSGKTLIMAALMLDLYQKGYRNFIFFVNSNAILEKTRANFCDDKNTKYLFKDSITIDSVRVEVRSVRNFNESSDNAINIVFNTIQGLHSLFTNEKENSLTFSDLEHRKIVFLADEAHHLNADTKKKLNKTQQEEKENWESVINNAFKRNKENLLLEFTATIPNDEKVQEKYRDKIVFEYALKEFYENRYSKKIFLVKYNSQDIKERFLGACLLSLYRQLLASEYGISLKPVVLFKSGIVEQSKENEEQFFVFLEHLQVEDIAAFLEGIDSKKEELLSKAKSYFQTHFTDDYAKLLAHIKAEFDKIFSINMNDDKALDKNQVLINSLESSDNHIRVIFAVNKLDEGWDVLNLFDIVRLDSAKDNNATTNAQLIGRGARYCPFSLEPSDDIYRRKFDDKRHELYVLEALSYHSFNESQYITALQKELANQGTPMQSEKRTQYILKVQEKAKKIAQNLTQNTQLSLPIATNSIRLLDEEPNLFTQQIHNTLDNEIKNLVLPLFSKTKSENEVYKNQDSHTDDEINYESKGLESIAVEVFLKAMNQNKISFHMLKNMCDIYNKKDFIQKYLYPLSVRFHKKQDLSKESQLQIALYITKRLHKIFNTKTKHYKIEPFRQKDFLLKEREIWSVKNPETKSYEWLVYDKFFADSALEYEYEKVGQNTMGFLNFIESHKADIDAKYTHWLVIRNEQFSELKIYTCEELLSIKNNNEALQKEISTKNPQGFSPDFIFWGKRDEKEVVFQCFIESKGEHLSQLDKWKKDFLASLHTMQIDNMRLIGLGFFTKEPTIFENEFKKCVLEIDENT